MSKRYIGYLFDTAVRFMGLVGSIGNAIVGYFFWREVSAFWGWLWLALGCFAAVICIDMKPKTKNFGRYSMNSRDTLPNAT